MRNDDRGANEIGRGGRQAHAEDQRRPHGQDEGYGQDTAESAMIPLANFRPVPVSSDADDDARGGTGGDKPRLLGPVRETRHTNCSGVSRVLLRRNVQRIVE